MSIKKRDTAMILQTPILQSTKDELKELQDAHNLPTLGDAIGWLLERVKKMED